ncbi:MAG: class I SAM-dependent methyltransferase [Corynebacterium sp.]|nr:class I SAM-dependent methyltransferase [Corynebacterium sp.]
MPNNEFGDFQTPLPLARRCLEVLGLPRHEAVRVLEPTCGTGTFLRAAQEHNPSSERFGLEINAEYAATAQQYGTVLQADAFSYQFTDVPWRGAAPLFVVGNPPWVTAAELRRLGSQNVPQKVNFKGARGIDALLGSSNFDVCEYIIRKIVTEFAGENMRLGMLCKTHVARNILAECYRAKIPITHATLYPIDAYYWFDARVDACWFTLNIDPQTAADYTLSIRADLFDGAETLVRRSGIINGTLVADINAYSPLQAADGACPYTWRSGLKHDAVKVFEFQARPNIEPDYVFPLLKSTDIFHGQQKTTRRWILVPQKTFGEDTAHLRRTAPKTWRYLLKNATILDGRKSSIYRNQPRFSVFGHGDYTFAPLKVGCSGIHKEPRFQLVTPIDGKPVVLNDTCYFLPFDNSTHAAIVTAILRSPECQAFINSLAFWDSKRPITKKLLSRINLFALPCDRSAVVVAAAAIAAEAGVPFDQAEALNFYS